MNIIINNRMRLRIFVLPKMTVIWIAKFHLWQGNALKRSLICAIIIQIRARQYFRACIHLPYWHLESRFDVCVCASYCFYHCIKWLYMYIMYNLYFLNRNPFMPPLLIYVGLFQSAKCPQNQWYLKILENCNMWSIVAD